MPFEDDDDIEIPNKKGVKQLSSQKSMFENKKNNAAPTPQQFEERVQQITKKNNEYKSRAGELAIQYKKIVLDKTLPQNKNVFAEEVEREILTKMINLAIEINNDEDEQEGMGSLGWITLLMKHQFTVRDKINDLEYQCVLLKRQNEDLFKQLVEIKKTMKVDAVKKDE